MSLRKPDATFGRVTGASSGPEPIRQFDTQIVRGTVVDEDGTAIPGTSIDVIRWTLINEADLAVINGRQDETDDVAVDADGAFELFLAALDNPMVSSDTDKLQEYHRALVEWFWTDGSARARRNSCEIRLIVDRVYGASAS